MRRFLNNFLWSVFALVVVNACDTESNVDADFKNYFIKYYGGDGHQEGKDFVINADGTVVILGTWTETNGRKRVYIVKTDAEGNVIWEKKIGGVNDEIAADIEPITHGTDAGNFILLSNYRKNAVDSMAIRLTIVSQEGDSLKGALFNRYHSQLGNSITTLLDGGYYLAGRVLDPNSTDVLRDDLPPNIEDPVIVKMNSSFIYSPSDVTLLGGSSIGKTIKVFQSSGKFYYAGYSDELTENESGNGFESNFFFRSFEDNPELVYTIYSGSSDNNEYMSSISQSPIGQFMAIGTSDAVGGSRSMVITRVSSSFQTVSSMQTVHPNAEGVAISPSGTTDFLLVGNEFGSAGNRDIIVKKVDLAFGEQMTLRFGSPNNDDTGSAVAELPNGDILILGTMELINQKKMALIKVKPNGKF